jgi:hypothetical protein
MQNLNPAYPDYAHQLGSALGSAPDGSTTLAGIYQQAVQQATLLSYLEDFKILGVMSPALLPLLLLVKPGKGGGAAVPSTDRDRRPENPLRACWRIQPSTSLSSIKASWPGCRRRSTNAPGIA